MTFLKSLWFRLSCAVRAACVLARRTAACFGESGRRWGRDLAVLRDGIGTTASRQREGRLQ